ncbi:hypothetical protein [Ferrimonas lipolytica]|uniref:Uncharacterized protein n=1 Tax=Ferrimonas lipolytica TaxID=2724191 RepID=A0A6H1UBA6_9GAMM|nr:hypothetical protein [Ferrimonas lipolytica]QIZ76324.1 hypothetical protein HER31_05175 [Ferrimonas lipolytica]
MTTLQNRWLFVAAFFAITVGVAIVAPPQPAAPNQTSLSKQQSEFYGAMAKRMYDGSAFQDGVGFDMRDGPEDEADINELLRDFPTASGAIHGQVILEQQHLAASEGNYEQAMRLMAMSFVSGSPSGSYANNW